MLAVAERELLPVNSARKTWSLDGFAASKGRGTAVPGEDVGGALGIPCPAGRGLGGSGGSCFLLPPAPLSFSEGEEQTVTS